MPTNLLLLPLLGGYWFAHRCYYFRFRAQRHDGYRLLIESALLGVAFSAIARLLIVLLRLTPIGPPLQSLWALFWPIPYSGTASAALLIGVLTPWLGNKIISEEESKHRLLDKHGNVLFRLLHEAAQRDLPISVTLANRKWYMGYVTQSPNLDPMEKYFALIPILSGYRDSESLQVKHTIFYAPVYEHHDKNRFAITIPLDDVKSANLFDQSVYETFFAGWDDDEKAGGASG